jgi:hypothetical protein
MTKEERANRNPAPEILKMTAAELDACRELRVQELQLHRVYILESTRHVVTFNYMGQVKSLDLRTMDALISQHFYAPRIKHNVYLAAMPDGTLADGDGNKITIREYSGPDQ